METIYIIDVNRYQNISTITTLHKTESCTYPDRDRGCSHPGCPDFYTDLRYKISSRFKCTVHICNLSNIRRVLRDVPCTEGLTHSQLSKTLSTWAPMESSTILYINDIKYRILLKVRKFMLPQLFVHKYLKEYNFILIAFRC